MNKFSENITLNLIKYGVVDESEKGLYSFGIEQGLIQGLSLMSIVLLSILMDGLIEMMLFLVAFVPLRIYAGGYHAEKELSCYILSTYTCVVAVLANKLITFSFSVYTFLLILSAVVIFKTAPVSAVNKPLDKMEKKVFGLRTRMIALIESVFYFAFSFLGLEILSKTITISFMLMAVTLVIGKADVEKCNTT